MPAHLQWQAPVFRQHGRQPGKSCKCRIGRQHKNQERGDLKHPEQDTAGSKHSPADLGENSDVGIGSNPVHKTHPTHRKKHGGKQKTHHQERLTRILGSWLPEHLHAVGDGFDTGHR